MVGGANLLGRTEQTEYFRNVAAPRCYRAAGRCRERTKLHLMAVNASIKLLMQLGLSTQEVARVLIDFTGIVRVVADNGPRYLTLSGGLGGKPRIASKTPPGVVQIALTLVAANQPAACCNLLAACGPKSKHLKELLLFGGAAALAYRPSSSTGRLFGKLAKVGQALLSKNRETRVTLRALLSDHTLPPSIRRVRRLQCMEDALATHAKESQDAKDGPDAAVALLKTWVSMFEEGTEHSHP